MVLQALEQLRNTFKSSRSFERNAKTLKFWCEGKKLKQGFFPLAKIWDYLCKSPAHQALHGTAKSWTLLETELDKKPREMFLKGDNLRLVKFVCQLQYATQKNILHMRSSEHSTI